ncbi:MAG: BatD family protein [Syntrophotaleaceae bacterium]
MVIIRLFCLTLLFSQLLSFASFAAEVRAIADRDRLNLGESLQLELRVDGKPDGEADLSVLEKDWELLNQSQSKQISLVNGEFNRSVVYSLTLMPRREGELAIPALCFGSDCSLPLPIRVLAGEGPSESAESAKVLLEVEFDAAQVLSQSQVLLTVRLLHRADLLRGSLSEPEPAGVDAVLQKLGEDRKYQTRRAGTLYGIIERRYAIFPQEPGTLSIPPLRFDGLLAGTPSRFDPFGHQGERIRLLSKPKTIEVLPPASDLADRSWLPALALTLEDDWQGRVMEVTVGEPATRTLTLTSEGLQAAQLPELQVGIPPGFKSYPDQPSRKDQVGHTGLTGVLQQKVALVPTRAGRYLLPAINLEWWDVRGGQWRTAHLDPVEMVVKPAPGTTAAAPDAGAPPAEPEIQENEPSPGSAAVQEHIALPPAPPSAAPSGFWFWLSLALGAGWLITLMLLLRERFKRQPPLESQSDENPRRREKTARQALLQAARNDDPRATRAALTRWIATLWPGEPQAGLERLYRSAPAPLRVELERLDRALYAAAGEVWTGQALIENLTQWQPPGRNRAPQNGLPELYPASSTDERIVQ